VPERDLAVKTAAKPFQVRLKKNILHFAQAQRVSLEHLAVEADLTSSFLSQVVLGRSSISLAALERVAQVLGVDIVDLLQP